MDLDTTTKRLLGGCASAVLLVGAVTAAALATAATGSANQEMDPHMPNTTQGYCPGGGFGGATGWGYCDGIKYPDGSYWHQLRAPAPFVGSTITLTCVIDDGSPVPPPAPPGGCGGAV
ncbi:hypothetical protein AAHH97_10165 [Mycolicibacterium elephantis]|uniref:hypothetical protein n=1 Tax=Mycolicibacterium elephantis TaxID=81858 RepID=UPI003A835439